MTYLINDIGFNSYDTEIGLAKKLIQLALKLKSKDLDFLLEQEQESLIGYTLKEASNLLVQACEKAISQGTLPNQPAPQGHIQEKNNFLAELYLSASQLSLWGARHIQNLPQRIEWVQEALSLSTQSKKLLTLPEASPLLLTKIKEEQQKALTMAEELFIKGGLDPTKVKAQFDSLRLQIIQ